MIRVLLSLLLLEVCIGKADIEHANPWRSLNGLSSSDDEHARRVVREVAAEKTFGATGNYISSVAFIDLPPLPDFIDVGFVSEKTDKFSILFDKIKFSKLSSAYALFYRIDVDAKAFQLVLRLKKAHISGKYCLSTQTINNTVYDDFEVNLHADLIYSHNVRFIVDETHKPTFGKFEFPHLHYKQVKAHYTNVPSDVAADLENYLSPNLYDAVVAKICEELRAKVSLDEASLQIQNEITYKYRNYIADRFLKAIAGAFRDVQANSFNLFSHDKTNFMRIIQNYDVRMPTYILRGIDKFVVHDMKIAFVGDNVHAKGVFLIPSGLVMVRVAYRDRHDPLALNHTIEAEFQILNASYEFEIIAKPKTKSVELSNVAVHVPDATVAPTQGLFGDEKDWIIRQLTQYIKEYFPHNEFFGFSTYIEGLVDEGCIAYETFKE